MKFLLESDSELVNKLVPELRRLLNKIDLSALESYHDVKKGINSVELLPKKYFLHVPTGWVVQLIPNSILAPKIEKRVCYRLYMRSPIPIFIERSKNRTIAKNFQKWKRKLAYRFILCLKKENHERTHLLSIERHISAPIKNASSKETKYALYKAKQYVKMIKKDYPDYYLMEKFLFNYLISNEKKFYKELERLKRDKLDKFIYRHDKQRF